MRQTVTGDLGVFLAQASSSSSAFASRKIARVEALGEPGVERGEQSAGFVGSFLRPEQMSKAHRRAQLQGARFLRLRDLESAAEERLGLGRAPVRGREHELAPRTIELGI